MALNSRPIPVAQAENVTDRLNSSSIAVIRGEQSIQGERSAQLPADTLGSWWRDGQTGHSGREWTSRRVTQPGSIALSIRRNHGKSCDHPCRRWHLGCAVFYIPVRSFLRHFSKPTSNGYGGLTGTLPEFGQKRMLDYVLFCVGQIRPPLLKSSSAAIHHDHRPRSHHCRP